MLLVDTKIESKIEKSNKSGLTVESVSFGYDEKPVVDGIDISIEKSEFVCLLGLSGSGKTTLLRLIAGLETPDQGKITWDGKQVIGPSIHRGIVFQDYTLFPWMSVRENIVLALSKANPQMKKREKIATADQYLESVGLPGAGGKYPYELSGGMRQRAAIARALALGSEVLLLDEPFGALDPINRTKLQDMLIDIWSSQNQKKTVIFVTHTVEEALFLGGRIIVLGSSPGRIIADVKVDFPRPRNRQKLYEADLFRELSDEIAGHFHRDVENRLKLANVYGDNGAGI